MRDIHAAYDQPFWTSLYVRIADSFATVGRHACNREITFDASVGIGIGIGMG